MTFCINQMTMNTLTKIPQECFREQVAPFRLKPRKTLNSGRINLNKQLFTSQIFTTFNHVHNMVNDKTTDVGAAFLY